MSHSDSSFVPLVLVLVNIVLPALWVAYDASKNRISTDAKPYEKINGGIAWFLGCVLFSMIGILYYLIRRSLVMDEKRRTEAMQAFGAHG